MEYEELLQMKRLLAAMRLRDPGKQLAASIVQRIAMEAAEPASLTIGDWRLPMPALRSRPLLYSPIIGLSLGLTFFGILFWAHPTAPAGAMEGSHRALVFEQANLTADEPPPPMAELTNGLMRESAPRRGLSPWLQSPRPPNRRTHRPRLPAWRRAGRPSGAPRRRRRLRSPGSIASIRRAA